MPYLPHLLRQTAANLSIRLIVDLEFFPTCTPDTKVLARVDVERAVRNALIDAISHDDMIDLRTLLHLKAQLYWHFDCGLPYLIAEGIYGQYGKNAESVELVKKMHKEFEGQCKQRRLIFTDLFEQSIRSAMDLEAVKQFLNIPEMFMERLTGGGYITLSELEKNWVEFFNPRLNLPK